MLLKGYLKGYIWPYMLLLKNTDWKLMNYISNLRIWHWFDFFLRNPTFATFVEFPSHSKFPCTEGEVPAEVLCRPKTFTCEIDGAFPHTSIPKASLHYEFSHVSYGMSDYWRVSHSHCIGTLSPLEVLSCGSQVRGPPEGFCTVTALAGLLPEWVLMRPIRWNFLLTFSLLSLHRQFLHSACSPVRSWLLMKPFPQPQHSYSFSQVCVPSRVWPALS